MAKLYVFTPPTSSSSALTAAYAVASGGVVSIPWSADVKPASLGGWETSSGSASAGYNFTDFDAIINNQISFGAASIVVVLSPIDFGGSNTSTPQYVFTSGWAASLSATQLYTAAASDYAGSGAISPPGSAQGVDNTAFPAAWMTAFQTAWINAITAALNHMKAQSYASKIAYVRIGGGAGGEWFPWGTAGLLTIPGGPTTVAALKTLWINSYMAAVESAIVALGSGFHFVQAMDGGFATESVPYNWCDAEATLAVSNGFGIGCEGLKGNDISAFAAHGTTSGGSNYSGFPSMDHGYNFFSSGASRLQFQTSAASDPTGVSQPGSLVPLLPYATARGATDIELYWADWQVAYDSTSSNYATYHAAYQSAITTALAAGGGGSGGGSGSTLTYPLTPPAISGIGPKTQTLGTNNAVAMTESPFTFQQQPQQWPGQMLTVDANLPPMKRAQGEQWWSWLVALMGQWGTTLFGDYACQAPQGAMSGTPVVNGANAAGLNVLNIRSVTASVSNWAVAGDWIQLTGASGIQRIYKILFNASSNGSGDVTVEIYPNTREAYTDGTTIVTANTQGTFRLVKNSQSCKIDQDLMYTISFQLKEAI